MTHTIYLSGPMAGKPDLNVLAFQLAAAYLRDEYPGLSREVLIPHGIEPWHHEGECPGGYRSSADAPHAAACYLRTDVTVMLQRADEVFMLPGWEASVGARLEMQVAATCGIPIAFFNEETLKELVRNHLDTALAHADLAMAGVMAAEDGCAHAPWQGGPHCAELTCLNYAGRYHGK